MTNLEVARRILAHMRVQGMFSVGEKGSCRYRGNDGTKCAAGIFIPDDRYDPKFEGMPVIFIEGSYRDTSMALRSIFLEQGIDMEFLTKMQEMHDEFSENRLEDDSIEFTSYLKRLEETVEGLSKEAS